MTACVPVWAGHIVGSMTGEEIVRQARKASEDFQLISRNF